MELGEDGVYQIMQNGQPIKVDMGYYYNVLKAYQKLNKEPKLGDKFKSYDENTREPRTIVVKNANIYSYYLLTLKEKGQGTYNENYAYESPTVRVDEKPNVTITGYTIESSEKDKATVTFKVNCPENYDLTNETFVKAANTVLKAANAAVISENLNSVFAKNVTFKFVRDETGTIRKYLDSANDYEVVKGEDGIYKITEYGKPAKVNMDIYINVVRAYLKLDIEPALGDKFENYNETGEKLPDTEVGYDNIYAYYLIKLKENGQGEHTVDYKEKSPTVEVVGKPKVTINGYTIESTGKDAATVTFKVNCPKNYDLKDEAFVEAAKVKLRQDGVAVFSKYLTSVYAKGVTFKFVRNEGAPAPAPTGGGGAGAAAPAPAPAPAPEPVAVRVEEKHDEDAAPDPTANSASDAGGSTTTGKTPKKTLEELLFGEEDDDA